VHTILLYGSRGNNTHTTDSDYDIAAFGPVSEVQRLTESTGAAYLDVFVYPECMLLEASEDLLRLRGSVVLLERDRSAARLLAGLDERFAAGPTKLNPGEQQARRDWLKKMAQRMRRGDAEGDFRRAWLLTALLEDYFVLRAIWYEGPKKALAWLRINDEVGLRLFTTALAPGSPPEAIDRLVEYVASGA
jgi:hypothetical protein